MLLSEERFLNDSILSKQAFFSDECDFSDTVKILS